MFTLNSPLVDFDSECDEFYNNSCFKLLQSDRKQWTESVTDCNDIGGYLTSIHSQNENEMLANLVKIQNNNDPNAIAWIGLDYDRFNQFKYPNSPPICAEHLNPHINPQTAT